MFEARVFGGESLQAVDGSASATRRLSVGRLGHPRSGVEGRGLLRRLAVLERAVADAGVSAPSPSLSQSLGRRSLAQTDGDMSPEEEFMLEQFPYCHSNIKLLADYNRDYVTDGTYQGDIFAYAMNQRIEYPQSDKDRYRPYVYKDEKQRRTFDRVTCVVTFNFPDKVSCSVDSAQFTVDGKEVTRFTIMKWSHKNCKFWFPPAPGTNPPEPGTIKDPVLPWFEILTCIQRPCPKRPSTEDKPIPKPNNDNKDPKPKPKPEPIEEPKPKPDPKPQPKPEPIEEPKPKPDPKPQPNEPPCKCKCPSDNDPPKSDPIKDPVGPGKPKTDPADDEKKRLHEYCGGLLLEQNAYTTEALKRIPKDEWYKYASNIRTEDKQGVKLCFLRYTIPTLSSDSNPDTPRVCELGSQVAPVKNSNPKKNYVQFILITGAILTSTPAPGKKPTIVFDCNYMFNTDTILHQNPTFQ